MHQRFSTKNVEFEDGEGGMFRMFKMAGDYLIAFVEPFVNAVRVVLSDNHPGGTGFALIPG